MLTTLSLSSPDPILYCLSLSPPLSPFRLLQVGGSLGFGAYYLSHNSDVVVNKKIRDPWNRGELTSYTLPVNPAFVLLEAMLFWILDNLRLTRALIPSSRRFPLPVAQDKNSKLLSYNGDFWKSRVGMPDPVCVTSSLLAYLIATRKTDLLPYHPLPFATILCVL